MHGCTTSIVKYDGDDHSMHSDFSEITEFTSATEIKERKSMNTLVRGEHQMY
jgi:hypothetical protein